MVGCRAERSQGKRPAVAAFLLSVYSRALSQYEMPSSENIKYFVETKPSLQMPHRAVRLTQEAVLAS